MAAVISLTSPKGGAGKTTAALVLATTLARAGAKVSVIDGDPNQPLLTWAEGDTKAGVRVVGASEATLAEAINGERARVDFVIVDTEGTASLGTVRAIAASNLVLVPMAPSPLDAAQAARTVGLIRAHVLSSGRIVPFRVLMTRTPIGIPTRIEQMILEELAEADVPVLREPLHSRSALVAMFAYRCTLFELDRNIVHGKVGATKNAEALTAEVLRILKATMQEAA